MGNVISKKKILCNEHLSYSFLIFLSFDFFFLRDWMKEWHGMLNKKF